jgi:hypothetical protein
MLSFHHNIPFAANALKDGGRICAVKEFYVFSKHTHLEIARLLQLDAWVPLTIYPSDREMLINIVIFPIFRV